jgi:magnesium transporter
MLTGSIRPAEVLRSEWHALRPKERLRRFRQLTTEGSAELFPKLDTRSQMLLLLTLNRGERHVWLQMLPPDDIADLILHSPRDQRAELLSALDDRVRAEVEVLLTYRSDVAGGVMSPRFARLRPEHTVDEAITYLRQQAPNLESVDCAYVLDEQQHLLGAVFLQDLFCSDRTVKVSDIMHGDCAYATEAMDQEKVAQLFSDSKLHTLPVLDAERRVKGVINVDDIIDVAYEEATEDIQKIGGMEALDAPYMEVGLWQMIRKRGGWLAVLFLGEMLTATAMSHYERQIEEAVVLALFIPLVISTGGNSGSQATTLIIRSLALGEIRLKDWWRVAWREVAAGLSLGVFLGLIGFARIVIWQSVSPIYGEYYMLVALTMFASLVGVVLFGSIAGSMLPFILTLCRLDPASASAPFVATLVDVTGLIIYFTVATIILHGTLL